MTTYIAFLRAINVGKRQVPMATLREVLTGAGFTEVATHIQTGNVRVDCSLRSSERVATRLESVIAEAFGFDVPAIVRRRRELAETVASAPENPLSEVARHYVAILRDQPAPEASAALDAWDVDGERLRVVGRDVHQWFTTPYNAVAASNAAMEKITGTVATTRSWGVLATIAEKWA